MPSNSSIMRQIIVLQQRVLVDGRFNEGVESWQDAARLHGSYEPLTGREYWNGSAMPQKDAQIDARIRIRRRKGINPAEHRVVYGDIVHDIISVIDDRQRGQTQLMVKARAVDQSDGSAVNV